MSSRGTTSGSPTARTHTWSPPKFVLGVAGVKGQPIPLSSIGGVNVNEGVPGLRISVKYMFAIFDSISVVLAVLGVAGVKPFHSLAFS
jgi:hypothetical protein